MKKYVTAALVFLAFAVFGSAQGQEFPVTGTSASGKAGDRVFLELIYDYGPSFKVVAEDFRITYAAGLLYVPDASTIDLYAPIKSLPQHVAVLGNAALDNLQPTFYALSYSSVTGQVRVGTVRLVAAFDILPDTAPGSYSVAFTGMLSDGDLELGYSSDLQLLSVTVLPAVALVPEPGINLMLAAGLMLVGTVARRRKAARA